MTSPTPPQTTLTSSCWLKSKIKVKEFDGNKQLVCIRNSSDPVTGVDVLLQAVAMFNSKDPKSPDEAEMLKNLFNCLCALLMSLENRDKFLKAKG